MFCVGTHVAKSQRTSKPPDEGEAKGREVETA
jgi:hypothetical protein